MQTFTEKSKIGQRQPTMVSRFPMLRRAHLEQNREVNSDKRQDAQGDLTNIASHHFDNDFSHVPIHADSSKIIPSRTTIGFPDRHHEHALDTRQHQLLPRIKTIGFSVLNTSKDWSQTQALMNSAADKSTTPSTEDQDQGISSTLITPTATGVSIQAEAEGVYSSKEFPDGFRWTQTIITNANKGGPLLATPVSYTDPKPNDDTKPFYWTDGEELQNVGSFSDAPSRRPRPGGAVVWDAILSLNGVNGKSVKRFDSLGYGFTVDSTGTVSMHGLIPPKDLSHHLATLRGDFPDWTFK